MINTTKRRCITLAGFLAAAFVSVNATSDGKVYKNGIKPFECINPTALTDGQPILAGSIDFVTMYVLDAATLGNVVQTVLMPGGCTRIEQDVSGLGYGQFYTSATATLTGGEVSVFAGSVPFELRSPANPLPPVIVE